MHPSLTSEWDRLEAQQRAILADLEAWPVAKRTERPSPDAWSATEVLDHLVVVERAAAAYLEKKLQASDLPGETMTVRLRRAMLHVALSSPFRFRVPGKGLEPARDIGWDDVVARWAAARETLRLMMDAFPEERLAEGVFRHPLVGYLTVRHMLTFFRAHIAHHRRQLSRIGRSVGAG